MEAQYDAETEAGAYYYLYFSRMTAKMATVVARKNSATYNTLDG